MIIEYFNNYRLLSLKIFIFMLQLNNHTYILHYLFHYYLYLEILLHIFVGIYEILTMYDKLKKFIL